MGVKAYLPVRPRARRGMGNATRQRRKYTKQKDAATK